jgi:hypothetical protein
MYKKTRAEGFGAEVKRRIMIGTYVLSHGYYDAYYLQAQKIRRMIADDFQAAFKQCDVIAGPVAPTVAWALGAKRDPVADYLADIFTLRQPGRPARHERAGRLRRRRHARGPAADRQLLQEGRLLNAAHRCSRPPTSTSAARRASDMRHPNSSGLRSRHRLRNPPSSTHSKIFSRAPHRLRRRAQHPGLRRWTWPCPARCR